MHVFYPFSFKIEEHLDFQFSFKIEEHLDFPFSFKIEEHLDFPFSFKIQKGVLWALKKRNFGDIYSLDTMDGFMFFALTTACVSRTNHLIY